MEAIMKTGFINGSADKSRRELIALGYREFTSSWFRGYVSRKGHNCYEYKGRYGEGYRIEYNNGESSWYSIVEYWVK